ncbi:MAG: hypothetical protein LBQ73_02380 [Tannerellaceae bacterium]|jgi:hypothetical protein|nr:hypothetical protein [Tannerellaceae bacterium]
MKMHENRQEKDVENGEKRGKSGGNIVGVLHICMLQLNRGGEEMSAFVRIFAGKTAKGKI